MQQVGATRLTLNPWSKVQARPRAVNYIYADCSMKGGVTHCFALKTHRLKSSIGPD